MYIYSVSPSVRICANRAFFSAFAQNILGHARALRIKIRCRAIFSGLCAKKLTKLPDFFEINHSLWHFVEILYD